MPGAFRGNARRSPAIKRFSAVLPFILLILLLPGRFPASGQEAATHPKYTVETVSASCRSNKPSPGIHAEGRDIVVMETLEAPNPCYEVTGSVNQVGNMLLVDMDLKKTTGTCVRCPGEVVGKITIKNLPAGTYTVRLRSPRRMFDTTVTIRED
jgi:hypothetical protein